MIVDDLISETERLNMRFNDVIEMKMLGPILPKKEGAWAPGSSIKEHKNSDKSEELRPLRYLLQYMAERMCTCEPISQSVRSRGVCRPGTRSLIPSFAPSSAQTSA